MFRRRPLASLLLAWASLSALLAGCGSRSEGAPLSVLLILTDQQRADSLGVTGGHARTPNLDALASEGVLFERAFCTSPQCRPSRWSIWTGEFPRTHGVVRNTVVEDPDAVILPELMQRAGRRTASVGKHHMESDWLTTRHGFDESFDIYDYLSRVKQFESETGDLSARQFLGIREREDTPLALALDMPLELHPTTVWADVALDLLADFGDDPFFLQVSFFGPHHPYTPHVSYLAAEPSDPPLPANRAYDFPDLPALARLQEKYPSSPEEDLRRTRHYLAWTTQIDAAVGRILEGVDSLGLRDRTLVAFTSDHGDMGGSHGMWTKGQYGYEELLRVPLIVRDPRHPNAGARRTELVSLVDLFPTFSSAAGLDEQPNAGRDLTPLLGGRSVPWREFVFAEIGLPDSRHTSVARDAGTKYVRFRNGDERTHEQLFDLESDPLEMRDRSQDAAYAEELERLRRALDEWERAHPRRARED